MYIPEVTMTNTRTKVFKTNKTQAVRLPKAVAFDDSVTEVEIIKVGNTRIISPAGESWDQWFDGPGVSNDFMTDREQPEDQEREAF
jgi:antitoxin VapB